MAPSAAPSAASPAQPAASERRAISPSVQSILQGIVLFVGVNFVLGRFFNKPAQPAIPSFDSTKATSALVEDYNPIPQNLAPIWPEDSALDVRVYVAPSVAMPNLHLVPSEQLVLDEIDFRLGNYSDNRVVDTTIQVPREVQRDGTLWAHLYIALHGHEIDPLSPSYEVKNAYHFTRPLNQVLPKKKEVKTKRLLGALSGEDQPSEGLEEPSDPSRKAKFASYYHPNFTMSFIPDSGIVPWPKLHPGVRQHIVPEATGARDASGQNGWYHPILFVNTFWQLRDHMRELNSTVKTVPLHIDLNNMRNWKFNMYASVDENVKANQRNVANGAPVGAAGDGSEFEEFKRILVDTNIYLLSTTAVVSVLHMFFEMLAFKNDVSHWRSKKDNVGVSVRTILANVFMQAIILLYLMDNREGTSWMILLGQGMSILLEAWKITKTVDVRIRPAAPGSWLPYAISFEDKHKLSEMEKKTQEYDEIAFRYLYMVAIPLLLAYAVYSVLYESHKSWYSFVITTLVGSVYAYGFLMMVPSLYINYRLKSVAHMPGKAMTYKFLNTFIDDLFAFTIKMPTLHRLATLRDDVIFFIYLYQCWKYKIDYTRVNEFGQGGDEEELEEKTANKPLAAPPDADTTPSKRAEQAEDTAKSTATESSQSERKRR